MARAITYEVTNPNLPGWLPGAFASQKRGLAYEVDGFFVHVYGQAEGLWTVSPGLTASEAAADDLESWVTRIYGATNIRELDRNAGHVVDGVWRPGLTPLDQVWQALSTGSQEQRTAEQSLYLLVSAMNDLFLYVEPGKAGLDAYGPKTRELLILACTDVEDAWSRYLTKAGRPRNRRGYSTNDYVCLFEPLHLGEYQIELVPYADTPKVAPFKDWNAASPTQSLIWYDAYNRAKHDRTGHLSSATIARCIEAVAANVALFCVRFSPYALFGQGTPLSSLATHLFSIELVDVDPASFYVPRMDPALRPAHLTCGDSQAQTTAWTVDPLKV